MAARKHAIAARRGEGAALMPLLRDGPVGATVSIEKYARGVIDCQWGYACRESLGDRPTGSVDLFSGRLGELGISDKRTLKALREAGMGKGKVVELWIFDPFMKAPELAGRGLGSAVLRKVMGELEKEGFSGVFGQLPATEPAQRLLERNGFRRIDFEDDHGEPATVWCMMLGGKRC